MNAREEFLKEVMDKVVMCAELTFGDKHYDDDIKTYQLKVGYDETAYDEFLRLLNFDYCNGYGGQELFGYIWYTDGAWSERSEYDGSEWWSYKSCPDVPEELK